MRRALAVILLAILACSFAGGIGGVGDIAISGYVQRRRASQHDKESDDAGNDATGNDIEAAQRLLPLPDSLLHHRGLQVELHPGRDRGAHHTDDHHQVFRILCHRGHKGVAKREMPVGMREQS